MSTQQNIIELVREFQGFTLANTWPADRNVPEELWRHFPAIAQAFLEMESAVKNYFNRECVGSICEVTNCTHCSAGQFLRNFPPQE